MTSVRLGASRPRGRLHSLGQPALIGEVVELQALKGPELLAGIEDGFETGASGVGLAFSLEPDPSPSYSGRGTT